MLDNDSATQRDNLLEFDPPDQYFIPMYERAAA